MTDNLLIRESGLYDIPRLAGGSKILDLVQAHGAASGEVTVGIASRQDDGHQPETHKNNPNVSLGFTSIVEHLRLWRQTTVGKLATLTTVALSGIMPMSAACGGEAPTPQPSIADTGTAGGKGGSAQQPEGDHGVRVIIGNAECYDGFAELSTEKQAACIDEFNDFSLEQVTQLSAFDQARWALGYRDQLVGGNALVSDRIVWTPQVKGNLASRSLVGVILQNHAMDVTRLSWLMQQPGAAEGNDPRTWAALFGIETNPESSPVKTARYLVSNLPAGSSTYEEYLRMVTTRVQLFPTGAEGIKIEEVAGQGYTISFTARHRTDGQLSFKYRLYPYLNPESDKGRVHYQELTPDKEVKLLRGKPLLIMPMATNA